MGAQLLTKEQIREGEVHVWRMELPHATVAESDYLGALSPDEVERAGRLRAGQVRMQFLVGRNLVRQLIGRQMGMSAGKVSLSTGPYGKPEAVPVGKVGIQFNVAHSRSTVLVALSRCGPVGVDVEYVDRQTDITEVAKHAMTSGEQEQLLSIGDIEGRRRAFFKVWTRKEAIVKADGRGLSLPLSSFEVPMEDQIDMSPIAVASDGPMYYVCDAFRKEAFCAALATRLRPQNVHTHDLKSSDVFAWK